MVPKAVLGIGAARSSHLSGLQNDNYDLKIYLYGVGLCFWYHAICLGLARKQSRVEVIRNFDSKLHDCIQIIPDQEVRNEAQDRWNQLRVFVGERYDPERRAVYAKLSKTSRHSTAEQEFRKLQQQRIDLRISISHVLWKTQGIFIRAAHFSSRKNLSSKEITPEEIWCNLKELHARQEFWLNNSTGLIIQLNQFHQEWRNFLRCINKI